MPRTLSHSNTLAHTVWSSDSGEAQRLILLWEELTFTLKIHLWFLPLDL